MRKLLLLLIGSVSFGLEVTLSPRYVLWEEFLSGKKLLDETGWLLGVGFNHKVGFLLLGGEVYGGSLDYDGQTQTGTPVKTRTRYTGVSLHAGLYKDVLPWIEASLLYRAEAWLRDIRSTSVAVGYTERWFYHTADLKLKFHKSFDNYRGYLFGTYRLMIEDARMKADIVGVPQLRPKRGPAYELGAGVLAGKFRVEGSFSYLKFKRSDPKPFGSGYVLQPESMRKTYSVTLGYSF